MRAYWIRVGLAMLAVAAVVGSPITVAETRNGRPDGTRPGPRKSPRSHLSPQAQFDEDLIVNGTVEINTVTADPPNADMDVFINSGDTPALRLDQSNAEGFDPQTWDIIANEANFAIRDQTNGSRLSFRIRPGAPSNSIHVGASGNVGLGVKFDGPDVIPPARPLHLVGDTARRIRFERVGATNPNTWDIGDAGNGTFKIDRIGVSGTEFRVTNQGMFRVKPVASAPTTNVGLGAMYTDTSGALCWHDGSRWLKVVGGGSCR